MAFKVMSLLLGVTFFIAGASAIREIPIKQAYDNTETRVLLLETSSSSGGGLVDCWNALMEIKSCSNEIILFFLNGQTDITIGADCCSAISIIAHNCWPSMLTSLGFTVEEVNILNGYCADSAAPSPLAAASPTQQ
ncbi:conserved hypothetical protein [Ricinus communis]|uniref:Prolamin-like domain-containing protein n=2 Tax=Ricinus communis TaxID=3988 RepID=B9SVP5_RICCO|nr:conserved hypothetical protein [Ricinus communis]